jgi:hypothetical protein
MAQLEALRWNTAGMIPGQGLRRRKKKLWDIQLKGSHLNSATFFSFYASPKA